MPPDLQNATLGTPAAPANTLGASMYGEISQLGAIGRKLPVSSGLAAASLGGAQEQVDAQKQAEAIAKQKAQDLADPNKYRAVPKEDGGFDFFDPEGNQVDIATLSQRTGTKPSDWVKDSQNPIDIQYLEDTKNLQELSQAFLNGDTKKRDAFVKAKPALAKYTGQGGIAKLQDEYKKYYQRYYVPRSVNPNAWGTRPANAPFIPAPQTSDTFGVGTDGNQVPAG